MYQDAVDGYANERECALVSIEWNKRTRTVMPVRKGSFPEMVQESGPRLCPFRLVDTLQHNLRYKGEEVRLRMDEVDR
jgi:hypothetical protein